MTEIDFSTQIIRGDFQNFTVNFSEPASGELLRVLKQMTGDSSAARIDTNEFKMLIGYQLLSPELNLNNLRQGNEKKDDLTVSLNELKIQTGHYVLFFRAEGAVKKLKLKIGDQLSKTVDKQGYFVGQKDTSQGISPDLDLTSLLGKSSSKVSRRLLIFNEKNGRWNIKLHGKAQTSVFLNSTKLEKDGEYWIENGDEIFLGDSPENNYLVIDAEFVDEKKNEMVHNNLSARIISDKFQVFRVDSSAPAPETLGRILWKMTTDSSKNNKVNFNDYRALIAFQLLSPEWSLEKLARSMVSKSEGATIAQSRINSQSNFFIFFVNPATVSSRLNLKIANQSWFINKQDYLIGRRDEIRNIIPDLDLTDVLGEYALKVSRQLLIFREVDSEWKVKLHPNAQTNVFLDGARMEQDVEEKIPDGVAINIGNSADNPYLMIRVVHEQS